MALDERDRENLLRDGRMMPDRGECDIDGVTVMVGFRSQEQLSLYCGADPVFQFNSKQQLRRVYFQGRRFAADNGVLVELVRASRGGRVEFSNAPLEPEIQELILAAFQDWSLAIRNATKSNPSSWRTLAESSTPLLQRIRGMLEQISGDLQIAAVPNAD